MTSKINKLNPSTVFSSFGFMSQESMTNNMTGAMMGNRINVFNELSDNTTLINSTYDILAGRLPKSKEEVIVIVDSYGEISDYALYAIGLKDQEELTEMTSKIMKGEEIEEPKKEEKFVLIIGNEGQGMSIKISSLCDEYLYIKMNTNVESLNAVLEALK